MKTLWMTLFLILALGSHLYAADSQVKCRFDRKDYESPGFGIPYRSGFFTKARFGCLYTCRCPDGRETQVTHVLEEKHFDIRTISSKTGGAHRAKWFICPYSVKQDSWKPFYDELGRILGYNVDPNYSFFSAERMKSSLQIQEFRNSCL